MIPVRRLAISEITTSRWTFTEDLEAYARTPGVDGIGVWRDKLAQIGAAIGARRIRDAGLGVSSLVFAGLFTGVDRQDRIEDARRAIDEAHQLGTRTLLVLAGPRLGISVSEGNRMVRTALEALSAEAIHAGVTLAIEPFHPVDVARVSTVVTLKQALDVVDGIPGAGIMFDTWHAWWDPQIGPEIERARGRIASVQLADWKHPSDNPREREVPGNGIIPLTQLLAQVEATGYNGWYEVELFTSEYQPAQYQELLNACVSGARKIFPH